MNKNLLRKHCTNVTLIKHNDNMNILTKSLKILNAIELIQFIYSQHEKRIGKLYLRIFTHADKNRFP